MTKMKKRILTTVLVVLVVGFGVFLYGAWSMFGDELKAIRSLSKIEEGVYTFTFKDDYGFKGFLEQGGAKTDAEMARYIAAFLSHGYVKIPSGEPTAVDAGCTSLQGDDSFARNFDFKDCGQQIVIIHTEPDDGYKSVSTSTFAFLGFGNDWHPVSSADKFMALASVYVPLDGMNEKGVCVADLIEMDGDTTAFDTPKPDLTIVGAIRLVLDYAASVDEAIRLLRQYDVHPSIGSPHHLAIADADRSVVVEWKGGEMHVTDTKAVTNHCLWEDRDCIETEESHQRMQRILERKAETQAETLSAIQGASYKEWTLWSVVYDRSSLSATWYSRCRWDRPITYAQTFSQTPKRLISEKIGNVVQK